MANYLKNRGITLAELLIVAALMMIVIFGVYGTNYMGQLKKANDVKRKEALSKIQKTLENFHGDHNRYPTVQEMAYETMEDSTQAGKVCGDRFTSSKLNNYLSILPCEPKSPEADYVYFVFDNYQKYALFTNLEDETDPKIEESGCTYGCSYFTDPNDIKGSISNNFFNYYVGSPDFKIDFCYGGANFTACYPEAKYEFQRCQVCTDYNCEPGYKSLFCTASWCVQQCKD